MEDEEPLADGNLFGFRSEGDGAREAVDAVLPIQEAQLDTVGIDRYGAAFEAHIRQVGLPEFFEGKVMRYGIGPLIAAGRGQRRKSVGHFSLDLDANLHHRRFRKVRGLDGFVKSSAGKAREP